MKNIDRMLKWILMALAMTLASGCATYITRFGTTPTCEHFYAATRLDIKGYQEAWHGNEIISGGVGSFLLLAPLITLDLPISLVTDTICLPYDTLRYSRLETPHSAHVAKFTVNRLAGNWVLLGRRPVPIGIVEAPTYGDENLLIHSLKTRVVGPTDKGFTLLVSAKPFQGSHGLKIVRKNDTGVWYFSEQLGKDFWLSRELFRQYRSEPEEIHLGIEMTPNQALQPTDNACISVLR